MAKSTEKPVIVWERGRFRVVAREEPNEDGEPVQMLVMSVRDTDALDNEFWRELPLYENEEIADAFTVLMLEVINRVDLVPAWVKQHARAMAESGIYEEPAEDADDDGAA